MKPDIAAILFDKDGTLLDFHRSWWPIYEQSATIAAQGDAALAARLLVAAGADPAADRVLPNTLLAAGTTHDIASAWIAAGSRWPQAELTQELDRIFCEAVDSVVEVIPLAPFFARLKKRGLKLGIASSDSARAIAATAERFGFAADLDFIAGYDSDCGPKPGPGPLLAFAHAVGVPPSRIAVVGDNLHDLDMAEAGGAGLKVAVRTGSGDPEVLSAHADLCLASIADLENALSGKHVVSGVRNP